MEVVLLEFRELNNQVLILDTLNHQDIMGEVHTLLIRQ
jgi:hypothetical protein